MRVVAGKWKGVHLKAGKFEDLRPITNRIKESLFGILGDQIISTKILDLYAGSGSIGIEALSRGASHCIFIERSHKVADLLLRNLQKINIEHNNYEVVTADVYKSIQTLVKRQAEFNTIFSDPPFRTPIANRLLHALSKTNLLKTDGTLILRHHKTELISDRIYNFESVRVKAFGDSIVRFLRQVL
ncbi:16S rRNA (guanine(966)-N(2))-methyltransferase RsmD [candidate division KSB1 bacterium]|nr:16S rRNA (guanine(966)-N(2))-methyltransferase RsmD [candidate division KSB1 bacterium]